MLIKSVHELKQALKDGHYRFAISLRFGIKSVKEIKIAKPTKKQPYTGLFRVFNNVDNTTQYLTAKQLRNKSYSNIGVAMSKKAFYIDD